MNLFFIFIFLFFNFFLVTFLDLSCFDRSFYFPGSFIACSTCFVSLSENFVYTMCIKIFYLMSELIVELRVKTEWNDELKEKSSAAFKKLSLEFGKEVRSCAFIEMSSITPIYYCTG